MSVIACTIVKSYKLTEPSKKVEETAALVRQTLGVIIVGLGSLAAASLQSAACNLPKQGIFPGVSPRR